LYQSYRYDDIRISGYNYGANYWYQPKADLLNSSATSMDVRFGYDSAYNLWVAVPAGAYTGLEIIDITNGYTQVNQDWSKNFTIVNQTSLTGTVQTTQTVYRPLKYNENAASATTLQTTRTIWGQSFNGSANVSGAITGATTGTFSGNLTVAGNVGIGKTGSTHKLEVVGDIYAGTGVGDFKLTGVPATGGNFNIGQTSGSGKINFVSNADISLVTILNNGNVGVGTTNPGAKLDVNGDFNQGHVLTSYSSYVTSGVPEYKTVTLNAVDGTTLDWSAMYRIRVAVSGDTSTQTGATYLVWDSSSYVGDARIWNIRMVNRAGSTSNHVQARLNGNTVEVYHTLNPNSYEIAVFVEKLETNNQSSPSLLGADYTWQRDINSLYYTDGNVGIGTTNPGAYKLNVYGGAALFNSVSFGVTPVSTQTLALSTVEYVNGMLGTSTQVVGGYLPLAGGTMSSGATINMNSGIISSAATITVNKLNATTIDPLYSINNVNYSTFAASISGGVKEEYVDKIMINKEIKVSGVKQYEAVVDFNSEPVGTDLWVWYRVVDFNKNNVEVLITPYGNFAQTYYLINNNKLIFRSSSPVEISYRLIGRRFDWRQWPTKPFDQTEKGYIVP